MNIYRTYSTPTGFKIGLDNNYLHIGVDEKQVKGHTCMVKLCTKNYDTGEITYTGQYMVVAKGQKPLKIEKQNGRHGLPDHKLWYYRWIPYVKKEEVSVNDALQTTITPERLEMARKAIFK